LARRQERTDIIKANFKFPLQTLSLSARSQSTRTERGQSCVAWPVLSLHDLFFPPVLHALTVSTPCVEHLTGSGTHASPVILQITGLAWAPEPQKVVFCVARSSERFHQYSHLGDKVLLRDWSLNPPGAKHGIYIDFLTSRLVLLSDDHELQS
jgi:hypothetical protein